MSDNTTTIRPFTAASFDQYLSEGRLMAARCKDCGTLLLPPRAICPHCHGESMEWTETSGKGKLSGFTVVYIAPTSMINQGFGRENPYISGIVELEEGVKIIARIIGLDATRPEEIRIGTPLAVEFLTLPDGEKSKTFLAFKA